MISRRVVVQRWPAVPTLPKTTAGKTSFIKRIISRLKDAGLPFTGFYAEGQWENDMRSGFTLNLIPENKTIPLCDRITAEWDQHGRFRYNPEAIAAGYGAVSRAAPKEYIIMDEIGLQELWECVWANSLDAALLKNNPLILSVQRRNLEDVIKKWDLSGFDIIDIESHDMSSIEEL